PDIDVALRIGGDAVHEVEFARTFAALPPRLQPVAVLVVFGHARIHVAVADVDVALRIPGHVGRLAEAAVDGRERRGGGAAVRVRGAGGGVRVWVANHPRRGL